MPALNLVSLELLIRTVRQSAGIVVAAHKAVAVPAHFGLNHHPLHRHPAVLRYPLDSSVLKLKPGVFEKVLPHHKAVAIHKLDCSPMDLRTVEDAVFASTQRELVRPGKLPRTQKQIAESLRARGNILIGHKVIPGPPSGIQNVRQVSLRKRRRFVAMKRSAKFQQRVPRNRYLVFQARNVEVIMVVQ